MVGPIALRRVGATLGAVVLLGAVTTTSAMADPSAPTVDASVEHFAPVLAFDSSANGYPMDAQVFFERMLSPKSEGGRPSLSASGEAAALR
jgi:hypothetical protein